MTRSKVSPSYENFVMTSLYEPFKSPSTSVHFIVYPGGHESMSNVMTKWPTSSVKTDESYGVVPKLSVDGTALTLIPFLSDFILLEYYVVRPIY